MTSLTRGARTISILNVSFLACLTDRCGSSSAGFSACPTISDAFIFRICSRCSISTQQALRLVLLHEQLLVCALTPSIRIFHTGRGPVEGRPGDLLTTAVSALWLPRGLVHCACCAILYGATGNAGHASVIGVVVSLTRTFVYTLSPFQVLPLLTRGALIRTTSIAGQTRLITLHTYQRVLVVSILTGITCSYSCIPRCCTCGAVLYSLCRAISHRVPAQNALITRLRCCSRVLEQAVLCITLSAQSSLSLCAYVTARVCILVVAPAHEEEVPVAALPAGGCRLVEGSPVFLGAPGCRGLGGAGGPAEAVDRDAPALHWVQISVAPTVSHLFCAQVAVWFPSCWQVTAMVLATNRGISRKAVV
eukprot:XP_001707760.1 Hypothetical protein GL50803_20672 [Giardia lamblia ATCC 50803]